MAGFYMKQLLCSASWALIGWVLAILSMATVNGCGHGYAKQEYKTMGAIVWNKYGLPAFPKQLKADKDRFVSKSAKGGKNALLTWPRDQQTMSEGARKEASDSAATDKLIQRFVVVNLGAFDGSHSSTMSGEARERLAEMPFDKFFHDKLRMPVLAVAREADLRDQVSHAKLVNVDEANKKVVAGAWKDLKGARLIEVEHHFLSFYGLLTAPIPLKMVRWCNGWIQFLTLWSFWVAVLLVVRNWICNSLLLRREVRSLANEIPIVSAIGTALTEENIQNLLDKFAKRGNSFPVRVYRSVFQSYLAGQLRSWNHPFQASTLAASGIL